MGYRENLAGLKAAYAAWNDRKGDSIEAGRELMGEPFRLGSVSHETVSEDDDGVVGAHPSSDLACAARRSRCSSLFLLPLWEKVAEPARSAGEVG